MQTQTIPFSSVPVYESFIYNFAVHNKIDDVEALNCHTLKTEDFCPDTLVEVTADHPHSTN